LQIVIKRNGAASAAFSQWRAGDRHLGRLR